MINYEQSLEKLEKIDRGRHLIFFLTILGPFWAHLGPFFNL